MTVKKINIQAGPGVYKHFRYQQLDAWTCLGEFVDNSLGSFLDKKNQKRLKKIHNDFKLIVDITRDKEKQTITIKDNAAGIHDDELDRALKIGNPPADASGLNEFGIGMKMSAFWFSKKWTITTTALGEPFVKQIIFDVDEIEKNELNHVESIEISRASEDEHWTEITLETMYPEHFPGGGSTLGKINDHLSSMYRRFTKNGKLELTFFDGNKDNKLIYKHPKILCMPYIADSDGDEEEWKIDVDFQFNNKSITGWVGLLDKPTAVKSGFTLLRRNRVIEGQERSWKPGSLESDEFIFFSGNAEPTKRLFGEFDFKGFAVTSNKSKIDWGPPDEEIKLQFLEYLHYLIKRDKATKEQTRFWKQCYGYQAARKIDKHVLDELSIEDYYPEDSKDVVSQLDNRHRDPILNLEIPELDEATDNLSTIDTSELPTISFTVNVSDSEQWNVEFTLVSDNGSGSAFYFEDVEGQTWPKEIKIKIDKDHDFFKSLWPDRESFNSTAFPIYRIIFAVCVTEATAKERGEDVPPSYTRQMINQILSSS